MRKLVIILAAIFCLGMPIELSAQWFPSTPCSDAGQNPNTAFPVCGTGVFVQASVKLCGGKIVDNPKCQKGFLQDINPYWYKFTCFETGTLGFMITPNSASSDYDWQLYDITGRDPMDVYTNPNWVVAANWCQYPGETGTTSSAANLIECEGPTVKYSKMPVVQKGHEYILLVSHFTNTQAGYKLDFKGGTAVITDTTKTRFKSIRAACDGKTFFVKFSKKVKCSSLAADGSDFAILGSPVKFISAEGYGCNSGFDFDSIKLVTSAPLPSGDHTIVSQFGTDGNSLLDYCDETMAPGQQINVHVIVPTVSTMLSVDPVGCRPDVIEINFDIPIKCSSLAADGSDFRISGPEANSIVGIDKSNCSNDLSPALRLKLAKPIEVGGTYTIHLQTGTDGNTIVNECAEESVIGEALDFVCYDTVSVAMNTTVIKGCDKDTLFIDLPGHNVNNQYAWTFDGVPYQNLSTSFFRTYPDNGDYNFKLVATNGVCTDSASAGFSVARIPIHAAFDFSVFACPGDSVWFKDISTGNPIAWEWNFGNGSGSNDQNPPSQTYLSNSLPNSIQQIPVVLRVMNASGCISDTTAMVQIPNTCYIAVPTGFTPNGDGLNDYLYPLNAWKAKQLKFRVFDRYGQIVWETSDWQRKWDGRLNGMLLPTGAYVWMLEYTDISNGQKVNLKGTTTLIR